MPTEENKAILHRAVSMLKQPDRQVGLLRDLRCTCCGAWISGSRARSRESQAILLHFWAAFPDSSLTLEDVLAEGGEVAARYVVHGTHQGKFMGIAPTGKQITRTGITILRFRDSKCVER